MRAHARATFALLACALVASPLLSPSIAFADPVASRSSAAPGTLASAIEAATTTDYPRAERELSAIRGADQKQAQLVLAHVYFEQGKYAEADRLAQSLASDATLKGFAVALRAEILFRSGKVDAAVKLLDHERGEPNAGGRRVRLLLGEYLIASGHRADAEDPLMKIIEEYNNQAIANSDAEGLAIVGRAAYLLRSPKDANSAFNESERVDKKRVETLLWRAELFLDKYDPGHAEEVLREAITVAPKRADALVMLARVKLDQTLDFDAADDLLKQALTIDPKCASAYAVRAGVALRDLDIAASDAAIDAGLAIDPSDLELMSLRAVTRFLADDRAGFANAKQAVFAKNGEYARFYEIASEFAEWEHRYDDIVTMMKEATQVDPDDGKVWAELGLTEMRGGDETAGLEALRRAWSKDHYNVRVFNTLNLYEQTLANQYDLVQNGVFKIRYAKDEEKILARYVPKMLDEAWASMKTRYNFTPTTPIQVELYESREQFSVRTSGLPNIGIQGVCFGRVVAAMSPKSEPFNWGNVAWHELAHVFAIQLSKNHVPRWFTEGLSEYETIVRRPEWARELDLELYQAITRGSLPAAVDMNRAFTHATDASDMTVAYYASSQMLVFTAEKFGMPKIVQALKLWGEGVRTPAVISRAFGVSPADYDAQYRAWQLAKLARYKGQFLFYDHPKPLDAAKLLSAASPNDAKLHADLALSYAHAHKFQEADAEIATALKIDPNEMSAHFLAARIAAVKGDAASRELHLSAIKSAGGDGYVVEMSLAEMARAKKDKTPADKVAMRTALEAASQFDPTQVEPLHPLYDIAIEEKRDADATALIEKIAMLDQHDRKAWRLLLDRLVANKDWDKARKIGEAALFVDVEHAGMHIAYARALAALGQHDKAAFELESALVCEADPKELATANALLATELVVLRNLPSARTHLAEARRLDPENAEAKAVKVP